MARRFDFVNISNPKKGLSKADRSTVRSQAAHSGYDSLIGPRGDSSKRRRRSKATTDAGTAQSDGVSRLSQTKAHSTNAPTTTSNAASVPTTTTPTSALTVRPSLTIRSHSYPPLPAQDWPVQVMPTSDDDNEDVDEEVISRQALDWDRECTDVAQAIPSLLNSVLGEGRVDPFWSVSVTRKPFMPAIIDHQITQLSPPVPELDVLHDRALLRYFSLAMSEPSLLYSLLAFAAAHRSQLFRPATGATLVESDEVLWLKGMAITSINTALQDPQRSLLDTTIGAVVTMASFEHIYGERDGFHAHMLGAQKMIALRGGLSQLGLGGLVGRIAAWVDYCQAFLSGGGLYFHHGDLSLHVEVDTMHFFGFRAFQA